MQFSIKVSASILSADCGYVADQALAAEQAGAASIHIDIMDGHYVHNFSFGIDIFPSLVKSVRIPLIAHLEIENPDIFINDFAQAGSSLIVVQEDTCPNLPRTIQSIRKSGTKAGIGINPDRGFEKIEAHPYILTDIDLLIVMAVYPGFGGQPFSPVTLPKIEKACLLRDRMNAHFDIGVDGAVSSETVPDIVKAGANYLIAGSSVFNNHSIEDNIKRLKAIAQTSILLRRK